VDVKPVVPPVTGFRETSNEHLFFFRRERGREEAWRFDIRKMCHMEDEGTRKVQLVSARIGRSIGFSQAADDQCKRKWPFVDAGRDGILHRNGEALVGCLETG